MKIFSIVKSVYYKIISPNKFAKLRGVKMGSNCSLLTKNFGSEPYLITLGDNVSTSGNVHFITHDGSMSVLRNLYSELKDADLIKPINVGNNVFIGINTIILPGSVIEDNVIIGAGSIVKGKVNKNSVYAGIPAKYICSIDKYASKNNDYFHNTKSFNEIEKKNYFEKLFG